MEKKGQNLGQVLMHMNRMEKIRKAIALLVTLAIVSLLFVSFSRSNSEDTHEHEQKTMLDLTQECALGVQNATQASMNTLRTTAQYATGILHLQQLSSNELMALQKDSTMKHFLFVDKNGMAVDAEGAVVDVSQMAWFKEGINGTTGCMSADLNQEEGAFLLYYTPFRVNNRITGVLAAHAPEDALQARLSFDLADTASIGCVLDRQGLVIACTEEGLEIRKEHLEQVKSEQAPVYYEDTFNGTAMQCVLYPMENGMILLEQMPDKVVERLSCEYEDRSMRFALSVICVFLVYGLYSALQERKTRSALLQDRNTYIEVIGGIAETFDYVGIFDLTRNRFTEISDMNLKGYGIMDGDSCDEVFRKAARFLHHPDLPDQTMETVFNREYLLSHLHERGESLYFEYYNAKEENKYKGVTIYCLEAENGIPLRLLFAARDLSVHKMEEKKVKEQLRTQQKALEEMATHDPLTGALNRNGFLRNVKQHEDVQESVAFLLIDLDKFKTFNDTYGHEIGDRILIKLVAVLQKHFKQTDDVIRLGGDEFAVLLHDYHGSKESIERYVHLINKELSEPEDGLPSFSVSVGCSFSRNGYSEQLYREADAALYKVKENGRHGCAMYEGNPE